MEEIAQDVLTFLAVANMGGVVLALVVGSTTAALLFLMGALMAAALLFALDRLGLS